ncbi:MAG TPA: glycosyltransferase family 4 protein [Bacteroidales bacterium]|nr:glycosyltransferase family 4 protein [Bacteroidales bacterium]
MGERNRLNILFITHYPGMYGANQSMCQLIIELRNNYKITPVVLLPSRGDICEFLEQNDIKYFVSHYYWWVNAEKGVYQYFLNWRKQIINLMRVKNLVRLVENEGIDLVYSNSVTINIGAFLSRKLKCPHIWHIRESLDSFHFKLSLGNFISKLFLKTAANKYILISDYLIDAYSKLLPADKIQRIYNGIDFNRINLKPEKRNHFFNMCMVGIISEQKNNMDALRALNILVNNSGFTNLRLHLIGGWKADYLELINTYIDENRLQEYVVFHGHTKDIDNLLSTMDLGLMCSRDEAFGRVTVEYMLHKIPVIASNSGANPELVKDDINGYLYSIYHPEELAGKIFTFIQSPEKCKQMGINAFYYGKSHFSSEQNTKEIYKVIKKMIH